MKRVLIANIFGIGDVLFTTPLMASLRKEFPGIEIDYLANARTRELVSCIPGVREVFVYEKDDFVRLWKTKKADWARETWKLFSGIRENKYDAVFDFTLSRKFGGIFAFAGIKKRIGLDYKKRGTFLTHRMKLEGFFDKHVAEYYLELLENIGIRSSEKKMTLVPPPELAAWTDEYLSTRGLDANRLIAVIPGGGASWSSHSYRKRWHPEGFAAVSRILAESGWQVIVLGDASEKELSRSIDEMTGEEAIFTENNLDLRKYISLLSRCRVALCNDGGPLHMAVALGLKTVSIFGPVDPVVYGPYPASDDHRVVASHGLFCRPCYKRFKLPRCQEDMRCLTEIEPEIVAGECAELLRK